MEKKQQRGDGEEAAVLGEEQQQILGFEKSFRGSAAAVLGEGGSSRV